MPVWPSTRPAEIPSSWPPRTPCPAARPAAPRPLTGRQQQNPVPVFRSWLASSRTNARLGCQQRHCLPVFSRILKPYLQHALPQERVSLVRKKLHQVLSQRYQIFRVPIHIQEERIKIVRLFHQRPGEDILVREPQGSPSRRILNRRRPVHESHQIEVMRIFLFNEATIQPLEAPINSKTPQSGRSSER